MLIRRARSVPLIQPIERTRQQYETRRPSACVRRVTRRRVRVRRGGDSVRTALESGSRQQLVTGACVLVREPRLSAEQLIDDAPALPSRGGARREKDGGWRAARWIAQHRRKQTRRPPWMTCLQRALGGRERRVRADGGRLRPHVAAERDLTR